MTWEETRGSTRVVVGAARQVAHADDAKSRVDEATRLPTRSLRPRVLAGATAGLVVLGLIAFLALRGGDDEPARGALVNETASPSQTPAEPTPEDLMARSQPSGEWQVQSFGRTLTTRDGTTTELKEVGTPVVWTIPASSCTATECSGTISSSSGKKFPFTWNGRKLVVTRDQNERRDPKQACIDTVTGEVQPIESSAARVTYRYRFGPFTGTRRMTSAEHIRITYEFFGDCQPGPKDNVAATYEWVLTAQDN